MDIAFYLKIFQKAQSQLDARLFAAHNLQLQTGVWLNSVVLKIQAGYWVNPSAGQLFTTSVFFSVWVSDDTLRKGRLYYNIHALKLRELKGYHIKSRDFAASFREKFEQHAANWPNVSVDFGPLTLMEGWVDAAAADMENHITQLAILFLDIAPVIDGLLKTAKQKIYTKLNLSF